MNSAEQGLDTPGNAGNTTCRDGDNVRLDARCGRCGHPLRDHINRSTGKSLQGWQASRFTGNGFCDAQRKSGGIVGSLQWCGCTGYEEAS